MKPPHRRKRGGVNPPLHNRPARRRAESKLKLTAEQEERLKEAAERRERQMAPLRNRALTYELEPAFVFRVKAR